MPRWIFGDFHKKMKEIECRRCSILTKISKLRCLDIEKMDGAICVECIANLNITQLEKEMIIKARFVVGFSRE